MVKLVDAKKLRYCAYKDYINYESMGRYCILHMRNKVCKIIKRQKYEFAVFFLKMMIVKLFGGKLNLLGEEGIL